MELALSVAQKGFNKKGGVCNMIYVHKCLRCGHEWPSKQEHPITCAKCRSPYWDKPKKDLDKI